MNLNTDKQKPSLMRLYIFYIAIITLCIIALFVFHLNIYAKGVLCTLILLCIFIMRSLKYTLQIPLKRDSETMNRVEKNAVKVSENSNIVVKNRELIDTYLTLLVETDEELSNDPNVDKSSPSYNNLLNHRIGIKLDAMS